MSSKQTFDSVTRSIRAAETDARTVIASAESIINGARRTRLTTVDSHKVTFDKISACLQATNQLHDIVIAHSHLVAENISQRSLQNVLNVRQALLETANQMLEMCGPGDLPAGVYNPIGVFNKISTALSRDGLLVEEPKPMLFAMSQQQVIHVASYRLARMTLSIIVSVESANAKSVEQDGGNVIVSVWEDRLPPVWDTSYHEAAGNSFELGSRRNLGKWTKQTDNALIDYVSTVISRSVTLRNDSSSPHVRDTMMYKTNAYNTYLGSPAKEGSSKFDFIKQGDILRSSIDAMSIGPQGELVVKLDPKSVNKATLARYILTIIQSDSPDDLAGSVRLSRAGYYEILFPSNAMLGSKVSAVLEGKW